MAIKVTFIGAGSIVFTRKLVRDILSVPELQDTHFCLHDISKRNLDMALLLIKKDLKVNKLPASVTSTLNRRRAVSNADYVINCARIGGLEAFEQDIDIPLKYGVDQCVGDTLCPGGIMYGQRSIPCILDFCRDIREKAKAQVLLMNYANPMAMNTWAAIEYSQVRTVGLCHGVEGGWKQIAEVLGGSYPKNVDGICAGINHQTWYIKIVFKGREISNDELIAAFEAHPVFSKTEKCRIDVLKRFGYFSTESNGHLSEYLPWYRKNPEETRRWIDKRLWIYGETGGYLRVCKEGRLWFKTDFPKWLNANDPPISPATRTLERASFIIEALETGRRQHTYVNVRNDGKIANLADDSIVEVPADVDKRGIHVPRVGKLPLACAATCQASINVQRMAKEAAVHGNAQLLRQAILHDPLTGAVCNPEQVWQMTDEMLVAQTKWLPQYQGEIDIAKTRLSTSKRLGTRKTHGAFRKKVRDVSEVAKSRELSWLSSAGSKTID